MDYFGSTNKGPPVYVASGNAARASRPRRGKRRKPTRKGRKRAPPKRTVSEIYRRKHNKTHLRDIIREERAQYRPQTNDEFTNENLNADVVSNIESLNLNNESISGEKGKIGGRRRTRRRRKRGVHASLPQKGGSHDGPEMQARFSDRERRACLDQLDRTRARLIRANNRIATLRAAVATRNQNIATLQARYDECEAHLDAQRQTLRVWAQRIGELQKQKRLLGIRLLRFREAGGGGGGGGGGGSTGALNGGGRRTRRRNRRRNSQRRTRRGGNSPLHIRRRLLALAARIKKWKNERQRHKDAKAKAEAEKKRSAFGAIPEGIN